MFKNIFCIAVLVFSLSASAQVKIGDNVTSLNSSSLLELESTTKGILFPRVALTSTTSYSPLSAHVAGMTIYNTAAAGDVTPGMYTNDGAKWVKLGATTSTTALNITAEQTGNYTVLATDDIILLNVNTAGITMVLPTTGVPIGKKFYVTNKGVNGIDVSPLPREAANQTLSGVQGYILMYLGGTGNGSYSVISGY
jgi:hypothetical protein